MGQQDVYRFLQERPYRWFIASEISDFLGMAKTSVNSSLRRLARAGFILRRKPLDPSKPYKYRFVE